MKAEIREWKISDAKDLADVLSNSKIHDNLRDGLPFPYTEKDAGLYISSMLQADSNDAFAFAVAFENKVIGSVGVFRKDNIHRRTAEIGYYIAEEYWNKGIMSDTVKKVCDRVFKNSDIIRIFAEVFSRNAASCRVLEKAGFECEGTLRANAVKNGEVLDVKMYSLIKTYEKETVK